MIPPSIVLIIYGLITETSIKALFTGAFVPGFMLASFIILYIIIRTQLKPVARAAARAQARMIRPASEARHVRRLSVHSC